MLETIYPSTFWTVTLWSNTVSQYADAFIIFLLIGFIFKISLYIILHYRDRITKSIQGDLDDAILDILAGISKHFYWFLSLVIALQMITWPDTSEKVIFVISTLGILSYTTHIARSVIVYAVRRGLQARFGEAHVQSTMGLLSAIVTIIIWVVALLFILSNIGINVTSLIAGVGIGGIVIAFAIKGVLEDLFSSFTLLFDQPFVRGDIIELDGEKGAVQKIGLKTTRLKSMATGEELIYPNKTLIESKIKNYHRMEKRRVAFSFGVTYETTPEQLRKIPAILEKVIIAQEETEFSRAHFRNFGDSTLDFDILYHIASRNYDTYLAIHQNILLCITEEFAKESIEMAFPTQTIHVKQ